jgi:penicillin-binding protein 1A
MGRDGDEHPGPPLAVATATGVRPIRFVRPARPARRQANRRGQGRASGGAGARAATVPRHRAAPGGGSGRARGRLWRYRRLLFLLWLLGFSALAGAAWLLTQVPLPTEAHQAQTTFLTDAKGVRLAALESSENREAIPLSRVPPVVVDAVVSTEDRNFFHHGAIDPVGLARATVADIRGRGVLQGGSTITQQYVKNIYADSRRSLWRKLREAALAVKVEHRYGKRQILERYLNTIYLGRGAYGVQAAARAYFGKDAADLGLPEASYLAGLIRSPVSADARRNPAGAAARRSLTLRAMVRDHHITSAQRARVEGVPVESYVVEASTSVAGATVTAPDKGTQYFVDSVRRQLLQRFSEEEVLRGGLRVRTSLDLGLQAAAYDAVYGFLKPAEPAGALVAVDDQGQVKAMVGGRDWAASKVNLALGAEGGGTGRQAGSTFKPFLLAETVREGYSVQSTLPGPPTVVLPRADNGKDYTVTNYEDADAGPSVSLVDATAQSVNTVYAQLESAIGPQKLATLAQQMGVRSPLSPDYSLVLGSADVSVLEMAGAYSTLANRGVRIDPVSILEVRTAGGTVLFRARPLHTKVLERSDADIVNYCLRQVVDRGTGTAARLSRPAAGKTGTTEDYGDAWFVGFTPRLTAAVWMGWPEGASRKMTDVRGRKVNGGSFPAVIWRRFMEQASKGTPADPFPNVTVFPGRPLKGVKAVLPVTTSTTGVARTTTTQAGSRPLTPTSSPVAAGPSRPPATNTPATAPPTTRAPPRLLPLGRPP